MDDLLLNDERWDRLAAGTLSAEEEEELRALADSSPEAREAYKAFKPLGADFQARVVSAINAQSRNAEDTAELVRRALAREQAALNRLVAKLTPVIQARVARTLMARRSRLASGHDLRQKVEDLSQEVFLALFEKDEKALRSWQSERGLSLENFVGLVAEREVLSFLRSGRRNPWKEDPFLTEDEIDTAAPDSDPEEITASRELLSRLLDRLREELSPEGYWLFQLLFIEELSQTEVQEATGLSADAVYARRSRLRRKAQELLTEMSGN
jgi:RNA polymerase sigma factor (sigma-70 family)